MSDPADIAARLERIERLLLYLIERDEPDGADELLSLDDVGSGIAKQAESLDG